METLTVTARATVDFGVLSIQGILASDGNYYVPSTEYQATFNTRHDHASRDFKTILGEGFNTRHPKVLDEKSGYEGKLISCLPITDWDAAVFHLGVNRANPTALQLLRLSLEMTTLARFNDAFGKQFGKVERDNLVEERALENRKDHERAINAMGFAFQKAAGKPGVKREFLAWVLEGVSTKDLVGKELTDSTGMVLAGVGVGKKRSYTKLELTDPEYVEIIRQLYLEIMGGMCQFRPGTQHYKEGWVKVATKAIKNSKLPANEKAAMTARAKGFID